MALRDKVQTLLEATLEEAVRKIANEVYEERYGEPLKAVVSQRYSQGYDMHRAVMEHVQKVTKEIIETDSELQEAVRANVHKALTDVFAKGVEEVKE